MKEKILKLLKAKLSSIEQVQHWDESDKDIQIGQIIILEDLINEVERLREDKHEATTWFCH